MGIQQALYTGCALIAFGLYGMEGTTWVVFPMVLGCGCLLHAFCAAVDS